MQVLDGYIDHIRLHLKPTCDYVLVTRNGGQHNKLGELMSKLVFDAIGKYVHPTRYRQIVETVSSKKLNSNAQGTISEDQKDSSVVARGRDHGAQIPGNPLWPEGIGARNGRSITTFRRISVSARTRRI